MQLFVTATIFFLLSTNAFSQENPADTLGFTNKAEAKNTYKIVNGDSLKEGKWIEWGFIGHTEEFQLNDPDGAFLGTKPYMYCLTIYRNNKPNGKVRVYYKDGDLYLEAMYVNGLEERVEKLYYKGKAFQYTTYKHGKRDGLFKRYHDNWKLAEIANYRGDTLYGVWDKFYDNGKMERRKVDSGVNKQYELNYYEEGGLEEEERLYGDTIYDKEYYENGKLQRETLYPNGNNPPIEKNYDENGNLIKDASNTPKYKGDSTQRKNGSVIESYPNGKLKSVRKYVGDTMFTASYSEDGKIQDETFFVPINKKGETKGINKEYDQNGVIKTIRTFIDDYTTGIKYYDSKGILRYEWWHITKGQPYAPYILENHSRYYYEDGKVRSETIGYTQNSEVKKGTEETLNYDEQGRLVPWSIPKKELLDFLKRKWLDVYFSLKDSMVVNVKGDTIITKGMDNKCYLLTTVCPDSTCSMWDKCSGYYLTDVSQIKANKKTNYVIGVDGYEGTLTLSLYRLSNSGACTRTIYCAIRTTR